MRKLLPLVLVLAACKSHHGAIDLSSLNDASVMDLGAADLSAADLSVTDLNVGDLAFELADLDPPYDLAPSPIVATTGQWTWVDVEGTTCNEGTQTGIGVNPGTEPDKMLVFFAGGGACGDYGSCYQLMTAALGPYTANEFASGQQTLPANSIMDRTLANNPFATWTYVFIPYCTGDLHGGIESVQYTSGPSTQTFRHMGHINALRDFDRLAVTWPTLSTLVVSGSSAGGYGSIINYDDARKHWPSAKGYLIDDSGPTLEGNVTPQYLTSWIATWGTLKWALGICPDCGSDLSQLIPTVSSRYPSDRLALLESLQDDTIRMYYFLSGPAFSTALMTMATDRIAPTSNFKSFFISGDTHTMLRNPVNYSSGATPLMTFIDQQVTDDPAWTSQAP